MTSKRKKIVVALVACLLLVVWYLINTPIGDYCVLYRYVGDTDVDLMLPDWVHRFEPPSAYRNEFLVSSNKLYLEIQRTRASFLITTYVSRTDWTPEKIRQFRSEHPKLESYWAKDNIPIDNVKWIEKVGALTGDL